MQGGEFGHGFASAGITLSLSAVEGDRCASKP